MPVLVVCCNEHFSVDGTLLPAWSSHGSFKPVDGQQEGGPDWWRTYVSPFATLPAADELRGAAVLHRGRAVAEGAHGVVVRELEPARDLVRGLVVLALRVEPVEVGDRAS